MSATMTYTILTGTRGVAGAIKDKVNHAGVPSAEVVAKAELWIYQRLRVRDMLEAGTGTLTASATAYALSTFTGYRAPYRLSLTGNIAGVAASKPAHKTLNDVKDARAWDSNGTRVTGRPSMWATNQTQIVLDAMTDRAYAFEFDYYADKPALGTATETNFLTERYPNLLNAACLFQAHEWRRDAEQSRYWRLVAESEIAEANRDSDEEIAGVELAVRAE